MPEPVAQGVCSEMATPGPAVADFGPQWGEFEELLGSGVLPEALVTAWRKFFSEDGFCAGKETS